MHRVLEPLTRTSDVGTATTGPAAHLYLISLPTASGETIQSITLPSIGSSLTGSAPHALHVLVASVS
jgi:hypothetical protein